MPRSYAHTSQVQYKRRDYEYKLLRENLQRCKLILSKMVSKNSTDENYMRYLNIKIVNIKKQLYQEKDE